MFCQSSCGYYTPMSFGPDGCNLSGGLDEYYEDINTNWTGPYAAVSNPYNAPNEYHPSVVLTPISLPDGSYAPTRTSPVLSHHSQEYQYPVSDSVGHHGLGITTTPYPSELTGNPNYGLGIAPSGYTIRDNTFSPQPAKKRVRRESKQSVQRELPVTILPHPEGVQRLEEQRRQSYADPSTQRRTSGRGRKDSKQAEEEDDYVEHLRGQGYSWKVVVEMFREKYGTDVSEAGLQMRQSRRRKEREAQARWGKHDVQALLRARQYWEQEKYRFIADKMKEFGATNSFTPEQCEAQLEIIDVQGREQEREREGKREQNTQRSQQQQQQQQQQEINPGRKRRRIKPEELGEPSQPTKSKKRSHITESHFQHY
ncbi:hypothetical protein BDV18DRAFT_133474 [Aspergillus unguis]